MRRVVSADLQQGDAGHAHEHEPDDADGLVQRPAADEDGGDDVPNTRWCQTSSIVSHEAKKLRRNRTGGRLRGARAFRA